MSEPIATPPGKRQASAARTREVLLEAGLRLAERTSLAGMSINLLVAEAGVSKGSFFHHFGDRTGYLVALHRRFHDQLLAEIREATNDLDPGRERLELAAGTYLDVCLRDRGVRALLLEARSERPIADEVRARNAANAALVEEDFIAIGWDNPLVSARLWIALVAEAALVELDAGGRNGAVRNSLRQFLGSP
jgi:AcrR family transcriptional regulator